MTFNIGKIRDIRIDELELMRNWRNAPNVRANMYTRHEISKEEHLAWWKEISMRDDQRYFMYEFEEMPKGIVAFTGIDEVSGNSSWAFYASPDAAKGTGSRMEFLALDYAFDVLKLHKLCCEVLAFNTPVIKLHQKYGFQVEGIFREQHLVDGEYVDVYRLGILAPDWLKHRQEIEERLKAFVRR